MIQSFATRRVLPLLKECGLTADEIVGQRGVQEVVYLLEQTGCELGYRFKWELCGPFSRELAEEFADLDRETVEAASTAHANVAAKLAPLFEPPEGLHLAIPDWLRLVVSVDFVERREPGITENGETPPFIALNYETNEVAAARERTLETLMS